MIKYGKYGRAGAIILCMLGFASFLPAQNINDGSRYRDNSVLSSGKWIKMTVKENAVYKLTYDDIKKQGISDPSKVKIYGYGGWILPEDFTQPYIDDLPEVSVYINKGSDGVFNSGDYLLFYGRGTVKWAYNQIKNVYEHENNPYSTYGSYFITESNTGPKEMGTVQSLSGAAEAIVLSDFDDYAVHEIDSISLLNSGRELFGESFIANSGRQSFTFNMPGITSDQGKACLSFASSPKQVTSVKLSIGEQDIVTKSIRVISSYYEKAYLAEGWGDWNGEKNEKVTVTVSCNVADQILAHLNFVAVNAKRALQFYPVSYTFFRNRESLRTTPVTYSIGNPVASCQIWDITQNSDTRLMETNLKDGRLQFTVNNPEKILREFVMVDFSKPFSSPEFAGEVKNQDLHALPPTDMVILTPDVYMNQAERLAEKHRQNSGLRVTVVNDRLVFNEFSSGAPDITAYRRFMKMFYDRATVNEDKPKYLLLFGDGLFDNRHLTKNGAKMDPKFYLLTYQVKESVEETKSYGTEDYIGFLDDNEGKNLSSDRMDLGIGRFPVSSVSQAEDAVNKVIAYMDNKQYGSWKTNLVFAADYTGNNDIYTEHAKNADKLAKYVEQNHPEYMIAKYYLDAYKVVNNNGKVVCPDARTEMFNKLKEGCFLLDYTGHGSTTSWSSKGLLNITDIRQMNYEYLPLWITATCDFGWFDSFSTSGGETAFLNKKSGAIALFTTSRVVYSSYNYEINDRIIRNLFSKVDGKRLRLGDIFRLSKNQLGSDDNKLNFVLLGDPALVLNYPEWNIRLDEINGEPISTDDIFTFKANDRVTISGAITDEKGELAKDFSGTLKANVFDSKQTLQALHANSSGQYFTFMDYPGMVYSGNTSVNNGVFNFTFIVPLDISYMKENGKIGMYAFDRSQGKDAIGSFLQYNLFGTNDSEISENGPEVTMFLNTENFKDGDTVNETPYFFAKIMDKNGINLSGGSNAHDMMISIDNNPIWTYYNLNNYYEAIDVTQGTVGFSIPELPAGEHQLIFRVWNIFNISTVDTLNFTVVKGYKPAIMDLQVHGNPARTTTTFVLQHNLPETILDVEIGVYDLTGRTVWIHSEKGSSGFLKQYKVDWDLISNTGTRVPPGIYVYRATVRTANSAGTTQAKKIIVLGQ